MTDGNGNIISWEYIKQLHLLQEKESLYIANKLRSVHVNFFKHKMKVRLVAQTFSKSVADALQFSSTLQLPQCKGCEAIIYFIRLINDLFDIFNSRSIKQYNYKAPINSNNKDMYAKLNECFKCICDLKESQHGNALINSRRNVGFLGFCISIKSLMGLYDMLCEQSNSLQYMCTYKLSLDHLELFFSIIRQQFGCNNNPSAKQFQSSMKKILLHLDLKEDSSGNCIPLSNINILHFSSSLNSIVTINKTANDGKSTLAIDESDCDDLQIYDIAMCSQFNI